MIDFRYLLITIVAIFLALGIGVLMGTLGLDQTLISDLNNRIDSVRDDNAEIRKINSDLQRELRNVQAFAEQVEPLLIDGALTDAQVVVFEVDGTDGGIVDDLSDEVEQSGGQVASVITFNPKLSLATQAERDELALILQAVVDDPTELRAATGTKLGSTASAAAAQSGPPEGAGVPPSERIESLIDELDRAGFIDVHRTDDTSTVPQEADFLIVGGSDAEPPFPIDELLMPLTTSLAARGPAVLVAEPSDSTWELVPVIRDDDDAGNVVATVDEAETVAGQIAVVIGLCRAAEGEVDHYGYGPDASQVIPEPTPSC